MVSSIPAIYAHLAMPRGRDTYNQEEPEPGTFGYCIFHRRWRELGLTQEELSGRIRDLGGKMKQGDISDLELGKTKEPRRERMRFLALALEVPVEVLYGWRDGPGGATWIQEDGSAHDEQRRALIEEIADFTPQEWARLAEFARRVRETRLPRPATKPP